MSSERVSQRNPNSPVATIGRPLVQEVRRIYLSRRNTEVAGVREVEHLDAELNGVVFADAGVLDDSQVNVIDTVGAKRVAADIPDSLPGCELREQRTAARGDQFRNRHPRHVQCGIQVRPNRVADGDVAIGKADGTGIKTAKKYREPIDYAELLPHLFQLQVGNFYIQLASEPDRKRVLSIIRDHLPPGARVFVGVIDPIDPRVETPEEVAERVLEAAEYLPVDRLGTCDDCGFSPFGDDVSTGRDTAFEKIRSRVLGTELASKQLGV